MCRKPAVTRKCRISSGSSSGRNARARSSGRPSRSFNSTAPGGRWACRRARRATRATSRRRCPTLPALLLECAGRPQAHERLLVVGEVGELFARERDVRSGVRVVRSRAPFDGDSAIVGGERPRLAVDLDGQRSGPDEGQRGHDRRRVLLDPGRQLRRRRTARRRTGRRTPSTRRTYVDTYWSLALRRCQCGFASGAIGSAVALHEVRLNGGADAERRGLAGGVDGARRAGWGRRARRACTYRACRVRGGSAAR